MDGDAIKGLIYAPALTLLREDYGLDGEVYTGLQATDLAAIITQGNLFVASVHHSLRWPEVEPPQRGGHLVLITSTNAESVRFHNPSGDSPKSRVNATLPLHTFDKFFAGRGMAISNPNLARGN